MIQKTIIIVGISGVGKTTSINKLAKKLDFQYLSAGSLIKQEKERVEGLVQRDNLRLSNVTDNQKYLLDGFHRAKNSDVPLVILDGHTVVDTPTGLAPIPLSVFLALGIQMFVFLKGDPIKIGLQRAKDDSRNRPILSVADLEHHQNEATWITKQIARKLSVPCQIVTVTDIEQLIMIINAT